MHPARLSGYIPLSAFLSASIIIDYRANVSASQKDNQGFFLCVRRTLKTLVCARTFVKERLVWDSELPFFVVRHGMFTIDVGAASPLFSSLHPSRSRSLSLCASSFYSLPPSLDTDSERDLISM